MATRHNNTYSAYVKYFKAKDTTAVSQLKGDTSFKVSILGCRNHDIIVYSYLTNNCD